MEMANINCLNQASTLSFNKSKIYYVSHQHMKLMMSKVSISL